MIWALALSAGAPLRAQEPRPAPAPAAPAPAPRGAAPADSARRAIPPADSARAAAADSVPADSVAPTLPPLGPPGGPLPAVRRWVFDRDALRWSGALTLGELLKRIPGVFLVRTGWYGQPETVALAGQGAVALELYWDGFQLDAAGADSAGFDTGRFDIGQYQRIEVEVLPTVLRVHLVSDGQTVRRARTETSFSSGDASTNSYRIRYLNRWAGGAGLNLGFVYFGSQGPPSALSKVNAFEVNVKGSWLPSERSGVEFQLAANNIQRERLQPRGGGTPISGLDGRRTDLFVHAFAATRDGGMGLRADAILGRTAFHDTTATLDASIGQASLTLGYRAERWSAEAWGRLRDDRDILDAGARAAWSPLRALSLSSYVRNRERLGGGGQREAATAFELRPFGPFALHGDVRWRQAADSTFVASDSTETVTDWTAGVSLSGRRLSLDVSYGVRGAFTAPVFGLFAEQLPGVMTSSSNAVQVAWQLSLRRWLTLGGWVRVPSSDSVPFDPPTHSVSRLTFRSAFLPHFRRNAFDLLGQVELEAWGAGVAGYDGGGAAIPLQGRTVYNVTIAMRLVGAQIYWTMQNARRDRYANLPGFELARSLQRFGIRWEFVN